MTEALRELTGAEAALVVNNGAGAVMLTLSALASGREVVVSRGQLVELSRGCRLLDMIAASGAVVREVGTTNATYADDYAQAITDRTASLWRVQATSFVVSGSTSTVTLRELVELGRKRQLPVIDDLGWAALMDSGAARFWVLAAGRRQFPRRGRSGAGLRRQVGGRAAVRHHSRPAQLCRNVGPASTGPGFATRQAGLIGFGRNVAVVSQSGRSPAIDSHLAVADPPLENLKLRAERLAPQMAECAALRRPSRCNDERSGRFGADLPAHGQLGDCPGAAQS